RGDGAQARNRELAADDDHYHPGRRQAELDQGDEGRRNQELVGNGVQKRPQRRDLAPPPREPPVQEVRRHGRQEDQQADGLTSVELREENDDQKRNEKDAKEGQCVREIDLQGRLWNYNV